MSVVRSNDLTTSTADTIKYTIKADALESVSKWIKLIKPRRKHKYGPYHGLTPTKASEVGLATLQ